MEGAKDEQGQNAPLGLVGIEGRWEEGGAYPVLARTTVANGPVNEKRGKEESPRRNGVVAVKRTIITGGPTLTIIVSPMQEKVMTGHIGRHTASRLPKKV